MLDMMLTGRVYKAAGRCHWALRSITPPGWAWRSKKAIALAERIADQRADDQLFADARCRVSPNSQPTTAI